TQIIQLVRLTLGCFRRVPCHVLRRLGIFDGGVADVHRLGRRLRRDGGFHLQGNYFFSAGGGNILLRRITLGRDAHLLRRLLRVRLLFRLHRRFAPIGVRLLARLSHVTLGLLRLRRFGTRFLFA